jgi:hypothetical protein
MEGSGSGIYQGVIRAFSGIAKENDKELLSESSGPEKKV